MVHGGFILTFKPLRWQVFASEIRCITPQQQTYISPPWGWRHSLQWILLCYLLVEEAWADAWIVLFEWAHLQRWGWGHGKVIYLTMSCKKKGLQLKIRWDIHVFSTVLLLDVPVGWRAETTQVTHEEQNLLERLCGLGLGYFKYSANILSAVS